MTELFTTEDMSGGLFENPRKAEGGPHYQGDCMIEGVRYRLDGWDRGPNRVDIALTPIESDLLQYRIWAADPHQWGPGKVHLIDNEDETKTLCGKIMASYPGRPVTKAPANVKYCKICTDAPERRRQRAEQSTQRREQWERESREREQQRQEESAQWWRSYNEYLRTPEWHKRRAAVLQRANGTCEGCGERKATQVHHLTYDHVTEEFLWELRAVCTHCHDRFHNKT